ncbi:MAG: amino acid permease [Gemmatimonadales bacterium]|nr:amino acid permease [Gemmatimonadales bacterium]
MTGQPTEAGLPRVLGVRQLTYIVIGTVIGSGIFVVPGAVLRQSGGSVGVSLLIWLAGGVLSLLGALTYAELGAMRPKSGGLYVYIRDAFGRFPAFLFGWTLFFIIGSGTIATLAVAAVAYLGQLVTLGPWASRAVAVGMIALIAAINVRGTRGSMRLQEWTTVFKVAGILVMSALFLLWGRGSGVPPAAPGPEAAAGTTLSGVGLAMIATLWAYEGWQYVTYSAGEARDPQRTFHRGIVVGTAALILIYLLASVAYLAALGPAGVARSDRVAADAATALFGPVAGKVIALMILVSIFSAANATLFTTPRAFFAMARDGIFFRKLAEIHPRYGTPAFAILACALWSMLLAATGTFEQLLTYVVFIGWIFYALGAASIFSYRIREPGAVRPFRVPGYPVTPILFTLAAAAIVVNTMVAQPERAAIGLGVVLLGSPAYLIWRRRGANAAEVLAPSRAGEPRA